MSGDRVSFKTWIKHMPAPGQRIFRSAVAVACCMLIYWLRGYQGYPVFSALAAVQCIQPYTRDMRGIARKRVLGTVIGAVWGLLELLVEIQLITDGVPDEGLHLILVPLVLIPVLYSTVLLGVRDMAYFSGVVYLSIAISHFTDADPYVFAFNRLLDTVIGVAIAAVINRIHLPRRRNTDTLFVSALGHSLLDSDSRLTPYSTVELNRLMDEGMKFTLSTVETPATVRELLPGVRLRYPIIVMDGAALYDMDTLAYLKTAPMPAAAAARMMALLEGRKLPFFSTTIEQNLLITHFKGLENEGMRHIFDEKRRSPYRNYVQRDVPAAENVVYIMAVDTEERIREAYEFLDRAPWAEEYRVRTRPVKGCPGYTVLKVYDAAASREAMLMELAQSIGVKNTLTFGGDPERFDVYIRDADRNVLVRELKRRFEPVDIRGWREIIRW